MKQKILWKQTQNPVRVSDVIIFDEGPAKVLEITQDWRILFQFEDAKVRPNFRLMELDEAGAYAQLEGEVKPPVGLRPRTVWVGQRIDEIREAIARYEEAGAPIPRSWNVELAALQGTIFTTEPIQRATTIEQLEYEPAYSTERLNLLRAAALPFTLEIMPLEVEVRGEQICEVDEPKRVVAEVTDPIKRKLIAFFLNNANNLLRRKP